MKENKYKIEFPATYDIIFHNAFSDKEALADLTSSLLEMNILPTEIEILSPKLSKGINFKTSNMDIRYSILDMNIDLEMQKDATSYNMEDRLSYYLAQLSSESLIQGETYTYKRCCVICLCNFSMFKSKECMKHFRMMENKENDIIRGLEIITIDLTNKANCDNIKLKEWLELITASDLTEFKGMNEVMDKTVERIVESNNDEEIRDMIIRQKKDEFVRRLSEAALKKTEEESLKRGRQEGIQEGREQGLQQGIKQGLQQGKQQEKIAIAKKLLEMHMSIEDIVQTTGLSLDEIKAIQK